MRRLLEQGHPGLRLYKGAYIVDRYNSPSAVNPDVDPNIVGSERHIHHGGISANSDYRKTAAVMKLVIDGNAAAGTIEIGRLRLSLRQPHGRRGKGFEPRQLHRRLLGIRIARRQTRS